MINTPLLLPRRSIQQQKTGAATIDAKIRAVVLQGTPSEVMRSPAWVDEERQVDSIPYVKNEILAGRKTGFETKAFFRVFFPLFHQSRRCDW